VVEPILFTREGAVATLTLNRPEVRNAICDTDTIQLDAGIHVRILTGDGSAFSSGGNLRHMESAAQRPLGSPDQIVDVVSRVALSTAVIGPSTRSAALAIPAARSA
jgi:enoyl-CoA hydratase/carnithine racemase